MSTLFANYSFLGFPTRMGLTSFSAIKTCLSRNRLTLVDFFNTNLSIAVVLVLFVGLYGCPMRDFVSLSDLLCNCFVSRTSMAQTSLGP